MALVPVLTIVYATKVDKAIPDNASPITKALELFREETGRYPDTLEALVPKHLAGIPAVRLSVVQPKIAYRVNEGKPYLAIPSATGDLFAMYEYDFETMTATWFGWRLIPLARKFAEESEQQDFAFHVEKSIRTWLARADVVWEALETMPDSRKNRESFEVWVQPLRTDAYRIANASLEWIDRNS